MTIWFTSDTHFNHEGAIEYCNRPFKSVEEMDETLISNWNKLVQPRDHVYHLGDFGFGHNDIIKKYRYRLRGKIHLILGNHDYKNKTHRLTGVFTSISDLMTLKHNNKKIVLCHYAMRVWDSSHFNSWQLFGHSHGNLQGAGKQFDVGVDSFDYKPISFEKVEEIMAKLPDNWNLTKKRGKDVNIDR